MNSVRATLLLVVALSIAACGGDRTRPVERGYIAMEGMKITAVDGSFSLNAGQEFKPPFQVNLWSGRRWGQFNSDRVQENFQGALDIGAKKVWVTIPGLKKPLYGVVLFNNMSTAAKGPATRMYQIDVPKQYIDAARGGQVSVVYELVKYPKFRGGTWYAWILWLSDHDFGVEKATKPADDDDEDEPEEANASDLN